MTQTGRDRWTSPLRITARDRKLLELLNLYGCVSVKRIKSELWSEKENIRSHYRRLGMLRRSGLIEKVEGDQAEPIGYRVTRKGKAFIGFESTDIATPTPRRSYRTQFEHDQLLIDIRRILTKSPVVKEFKTESEVRYEILGRQNTAIDWKHVPAVPDATFVFSVPGKQLRVALELELSGKSKARYRRIFRNHLLSNRWSVVFYIVKSGPLLGHLKEQLNQTKLTDPETLVAKRINGIYFCSLEDFLSLELSTPFSNSKEEISLAEMAKKYGFNDAKITSADSTAV